MLQYAVWIEPAIIHEWITLMKGYENNKNLNLSYDDYLNALLWLDPKRDTSEVRKIISKLQENGETVRCVWTNIKLTNEYEVDHCFPFSRWPNNDLWNLLPSTKTANGNKLHKLPTLELLDASKERIINWWEQSYYINDDYLKNRFLQEARCSLPLIVESNNIDTIFSGLETQRIRLKQLQQIDDWHGP